MKKSLLYASLILLATACNREKKLFTLLDSKTTGITFANTIRESDTLNILNSEFIYNGGGVGIGDLNGDGLPDIYFTGNQVDNKLYLNRGKLHFEDVTEKANAQKKQGQWSSGVNMVDLNHDGKLDIYVCNTFRHNADLRRNLLFINQGNDANGVPHFQEMANAYGIDDTTHASGAQFFDYDNDGDLDLFITTNYMDRRNPSQYVTKKTDGSDINRDRLYRNDWDEKLGHPVFKEVTLAAGLKLDGFSHSGLIVDFNEDGWPDIYVANDYVTNDLIYINNQDGTFTNHIARIFKHQAYSAMGSDVADINNDGKPDLFTSEMLPYYNKRKKLFLNANNYSVYANNDQYGYEYQYVRNTLQLNRGIDPQSGLPVFSDIAFYAGVQETEWSWSPLMADFDNDGNRDLFVTNGFPRDVTDHDFGAYRSSYNYLVAPMDLQDMIPKIKVPKFMFKNNGDLRFLDVSAAWGLNIPAFSNGSAYADLDNDGDLDLVVNNIDDPAFVFENTLDNTGKNNNYIRVRLDGGKNNPDAFGATVTAWWQGNQQVAVQESARGYMSTSENIAHFGLGNAQQADSIIVRWKNREYSKITGVTANQTITVHYGENPSSSGRPVFAGLFDRLDSTILGFSFVHDELDFVDFDVQRTLAHKFSQYGPGVAIGDVNGDGLDDVYLSGSSKRNGTWLIQTPEGKFVKRTAVYKTDMNKNEEELGVLLFDADHDGDNDLYIVHGSNEFNPGSLVFQDVLCVNDGKGNFTIAPDALPKEVSCGQVVRAVDIDGDGDLDLFVGARLLPLSFPKADRSFILRNDSKEKDHPVFTDVTQAVCPELQNIGMISDALWTDFNNDQQPDLVLAGEWMPLTFFQNEGGKFKNITAKTGISQYTGWWNSLAAGDFDNDGDIDYIAGNFGGNTYFKCNESEPLTVYAKDFDSNSSFDPFISLYWQDSLGNRKEYFYHSRDDMAKQLIQIRRKFKTYAAFGDATASDVFSSKELEGAMILKTNWMYSSYVENLGNGTFKITPLPAPAQLAPIYGMLPYDVDHDGLLDLLMIGNDYGMELLQGRADAFNGLVLRNTGKGVFKPVELEASHLMVPYDARALTRIALAGSREAILATQNRGQLLVFAPHKQWEKLIPLAPAEVTAEITYQNGQKQRREFYWGSSFLSQEPRNIQMDAAMAEISFFDGAHRLTRKVK
jgi:hypothetical protein